MRPSRSIFTVISTGPATGARGNCDRERARRPFERRRGLDRPQDDRRHVAAVGASLDPPALAHLGPEATVAEVLDCGVEVERVHGDRRILADWLEHHA